MSSRRPDGIAAALLAAGQPHHRGLKSTSSSPVVVVDLFSGGGGGWCLAARALGLDAIGIEWDAASCRTRSAVGLRTIRADVATYPPERFAGAEGLCGSPPCQAFSSAGKRAGLADPRGQLVHEPMRYVRVIRPRWVALEQVPEVLGYWRWIAQELRTMGYSAWAGILNAADYGVPQVRKRAILLASLDRAAVPPAPTHSKHGDAEMFGGSRLPWVPMAEALGWGLTQRPAYVVVAREAGGGAALDGGARSREEIRRAQVEGRWRVRQAVDIDQPAPTVDTMPGRWKLRSPGRSAVTPPRRAEATTDPAPTVALGHNATSWCWERPATTVMGDERVFPPGGHHPESGDNPWSARATRVTIAELGVLQGFPADHPWQPPHVSRQIGNAIPPPLAEACLRALVG